MPTKKKKAAKSKAVVRHTKTKKVNLKEQSTPLKILLLLLVILFGVVIGMLVYSEMKASDLRAKATKWTTITPPGKDSGIDFVACKTAVGQKYDVTVVAAKPKELNLTRRDADDKSLSNHPPFPLIFAGAYAKTTSPSQSVGYYWKGRVSYPSESANRWWANEVTATKLSALNGQTLANGTDKLLVYGMSNVANAPTFRRSGSGQVFVTGGFTDTPPQPENFDSPAQYKAKRAAWERSVPSVQRLSSCQ